MRIMKKFVLAVACLVAACGSPVPAQVLDVELRAADSPAGERIGMSNLFFEAGASVTVPPAWDSAATAVLTRVDARDVLMVRGWSKGASEYRVDVDGDRSVADDAPLDFREVGEFSVAVVDLPPGADGTPALNLHVIVAENYVYARAARTWRGEIELPGRKMAVGVRPESRMEPVPTEGASFELLLDLDGDGEFREASEVRADGGVAPGEMVPPARPFMVEGRAYRLGALDVGEGKLRLVPTRDSVAASRGFFAPSLETTTLDGRTVSLAELRGRVVVIEFWSTHCPLSERIRPEIAELEERHPDVTWIAVARETEADSVRAHLADHPMAGELWANRPEVCETWNPRSATPLFYVIDREGRIVTVEKGAGSSPVLEAWLEEAR